MLVKFLNESNNPILDKDSHQNPGVTLGNKTLHRDEKPILYEAYSF